MMMMMLNFQIFEFLGIGLNVQRRNIYKYYRKKLIQRSKNQGKEIEDIKKVPVHPCERLKRKNRLKEKPELKYLKMPWYHLTPEIV